MLSALGEVAAGFKLRGRLKLMLPALLLVLVLLASPANAADSAPAANLEFHKYNEALELAAKEKKQVLIYFWAKWCHYCGLVNDEVFPDSKVEAELKKDFILVAVDVDNDPGKIAKKYRSKAMPTFVFLDDAGEELDRLAGYVPAADFVSILSYFGTRAYETMDFDEYAGQ